MDFDLPPPSALRTYLSDIKHYAQASAPEECCGIINTELRACPKKNQSPRPLDSFVIDTHDLGELYPEIRAVYHSHPSTSSNPSVTDRRYCNEINLPFIIYSIPDDHFSLLMPE